mmetsp:Transcript_4842/g.8719  ORF Transcript_4842/g.8719 Transcript_4842/m.8719 type:complete len:81 (+) Transcript_4842:1097-1339(+)
MDMSRLCHPTIRPLLTTCLIRTIKDIICMDLMVRAVLLRMAQGVVTEEKEEAEVLHLQFLQDLAKAQRVLIYSSTTSRLI